MNRNSGNKILPVIWVGIFGLALVFACTKIDYVGESYSPTTQVDMYFSEDEVTREHRVMGRMVAHANDAVSAEKMQKKMMKKAREKGADGIIILGLERYQSGETTTHEENTKDTKKGTKTRGVVKTEVKFEKEIKAILIKYK